MIVFNAMTSEGTAARVTLMKRRNSDSLLPSQAESLKEGFKEVEEEHKEALKRLEKRYKNAFRQLHLKHRVCKVLKTKSCEGASKEG
ncbi:hypothetical protein Gasu2_64960 [Galdieria sulphuraria]|uniref:Uncharacterized protein n=1 Tax=Galdieria sulphuraria TaxID=130081 RepID=M2Y5I7_GALSU|nr:hypothetical protein Gasu_16170 isoform 2 [Galdieria sulphuraria]XP_005707639.1 hypothetical protein Gasu_16170 isoform 1 [Galdieria sulphuraria]EME31118.1 hypothetical protein isoform 2 [Galdieria sulphuraria]EME31119.1 hypothetical protein isoform 1 [Galdieria sulphuraria]GJD12412.1 hypothetical protein Gasu2_64960 [Galdieria sulphuraria]|eukprot:XP_005707638.1 hypothetical protein isoform 2 [Galdieria sulphuraria]